MTPVSGVLGVIEPVAPTSGRRYFSAPTIPNHRNARRARTPNKPKSPATAKAFTPLKGCWVFYVHFFHVYIKRFKKEATCLSNSQRKIRAVVAAQWRA